MPASSNVPQQSLFVPQTLRDTYLTTGNFTFGTYMRARQVATTSVGGYFCHPCFADSLLNELGFGVRIAMRSGIVDPVPPTNVVAMDVGLTTIDLQNNVVDLLVQARALLSPGINKVQTIDLIDGAGSEVLFDPFTIRQGWMYAFRIVRDGPAVRDTYGANAFFADAFVSTHRDD